MQMKKFRLSTMLFALLLVSLFGCAEKEKDENSSNKLLWLSMIGGMSCEISSTSPWESGLPEYWLVEVIVNEEVLPVFVSKAVPADSLRAGKRLIVTNHGFRGHSTFSKYPCVGEHVAGLSAYSIMFLPFGERNFWQEQRLTKAVAESLYTWLSSANSDSTPVYLSFLPLVKELDHMPRQQLDFYNDLDDRHPHSIMSQPFKGPRQLQAEAESLCTLLSRADSDRVNAGKGK